MKQIFNRQNLSVQVSSPYVIYSKLSYYWYLSVIMPVFLLLVLTGCQKNALQESSLKSNTTSNALRQKGVTRCIPFKASFVTMDEITQVPTDAIPIQKDHITGSGVGTVIGKAFVDTYAAGDVTLPFPALVTSTTTFIAANGDKIFASNDGYLQEPSANGDLHLAGNGTITGGTGRFAGATGNFSFDVTGNIFKPEGGVTFTGTICF